MMWSKTILFQVFKDMICVQVNIIIFVKFFVVSLHFVDKFVRLQKGQQEYSMLYICHNRLHAKLCGNSRSNAGNCSNWSCLEFNFTRFWHCGEENNLPVFLHPLIIDKHLKLSDLSCRSFPCMDLHQKNFVELMMDHASYFLYFANSLPYSGSSCRFWNYVPAA